MKTVIEMAREAGATPYTNRHYPDRPTHTFNVDQLERFAELVRADEREACAKVCDETLAQHYMKQMIPARDEALFLAACADCSAAIRARGHT